MPWSDWWCKLWEKKAWIHDHAGEMSLEPDTDPVGFSVRALDHLGMNLVTHGLTCILTRGTRGEITMSDMMPEYHQQLADTWADTKRIRLWVYRSFKLCWSWNLPLILLSRADALLKPLTTRMAWRLEQVQHTWWLHLSSACNAHPVVSPAKLETETAHLASCGF